MKQLIIDTSTNLLYVGLINGTKEDYITRLGKNDNAAYLVDKIEELLKRNKINLSDLDSIIVGVGPGSYTGARVSVVVAKMLSFSKAITLKKISSIQLLSSGYSNIKAIIDARRGYYFLGQLYFNEYIDKYVMIDDIKDYLLLSEETIKVNLKMVSRYAKEVENVHDLEPNYLRKTEAETVYDQKNAIK